MIQLKEKLTKYMSEHPIDFGTSDAETILDFLYGAYAEAHEMFDVPQTANAIMPVHRT